MLFASIASPAMLGKARLEFITSNSQTISGKTILMVILVTDRVGEWNLGMVTTFCHHNQAKMEASDAFSALHLCNSLEPSALIVRRYTNTPYIPGGSSHLPYLHMSILSGGASSTQSHWTSYVYAGCSPSLTLGCSCLEKRERWDWKCFPTSYMLHGKAQKRSTISLTWFCCQSLHQPLIPIKKRAPRLGGGSGFHQALKLLHDVNQARAQLECELAQENRSWLKDTTRGRSNWLGGMREGKHRWSSRQMPPFKRSFPRQAQLTLSGYCLGASSLQFPSAIWVECWPLTGNRMRTSQLPPLHLSLRAYRLQAPQAVQLMHPDLDHFQYLPYWISLCRHSPSGAPICRVPCHPHTEKVEPLFKWFIWWSLWQEDPCWLPRGQG